MFLQTEHSAVQSVLKHHCGYNREVLLCGCPFCCTCGWNDPDLGAPGGDRMSPPGSPSHGCPEGCSFHLDRAARVCPHTPASLARHYLQWTALGHPGLFAGRGPNHKEGLPLLIWFRVFTQMSLPPGSPPWQAADHVPSCAPLCSSRVCSVWLQVSPLSGAEFPENRTITFPS